MDQRSARFRKITNNHKGIALIITLLVVTIMIVSILEFNTLMRINGQAAWNFRDQTAAYYLAKAGLNATFALLSNDQSYQDLMNILIKGEEFGFIPIGAPVLESEQEGTYSYVINRLPIGDGYLTLEIKDEDGKYNINSLVVMTEQQTGTTGGTTKGPGNQAGATQQTGAKVLVLGSINPDMHHFMQGLFELLAIDIETLYALEDWLDFGESDTAQGLETEGSGIDLQTGLPYRVKNGPLETITELRMIKGFDDQVLTSLGVTREEGFLNPETNKFFTVYPTLGININTAPSSLLQALSNQITPTLAQDLIALRKKQPFRDIGSFKSQYAVDPSITLSVNSSFFRIRAIANYHDIIRVITTVVRRQPNNIDIFYWRVD